LNIPHKKSDCSHIITATHVCYNWEQAAMKWKTATLKARLHIIAAVVLLIGLGGATLIYFTADDASENMSIYEFEHSKIYRHDLELYGGKINVLASEFMQWFDGLWHGRSFAYTLAFIAISISCVVVFIASLSSTDENDS
jgi:hypothetical protein